MFNTINLKKLFLIVPLVGLVFFSHTPKAYAWFWEEHYHHDSYPRYHHHYHYPYGSIVFTLPHGFITVALGGERYYYCDGVYYRPVPRGYEIVVPPTPVVVEAAAVTADTAPQRQQEEFTVNIPNSKGGYTAVTLKRSGSGFVGPQGEFYVEFPKIEQLKLMYYGK